MVAITTNLALFVIQWAVRRKPPVISGSAGSTVG